MLTRAAQRRQALRFVRRTADQIQLPWLCPALSTPRSSPLQRRTSSTRPLASPTLRVNLQASQIRRLASAARITDDFDAGDEYLPLSYERHAPAMYGRDPSANFDLSQCVFIDTTATIPEDRSSWKRLGIKSTPSEIETMLDACLQVQKWDRAFALLGPLKAVFATNLVKLQQIYNRVLEAMVFDIIWNRNSENAQRINKWIEVDMRAAGIDPTAQTFALKIKTALATKTGSQRIRTVRRYWQMAQDYQLENEVASMRHILSDSDLGALSEICPVAIAFDLTPEFPMHEEENLEISQQHEPITGTIEDAAQMTIKETEQKGLGLATLKKALASFNDPIPPTPVAETEQMTEPQRRQLRLEADSLSVAVARWKVEHEKRMKMGLNTSLTKGRCGALLWQWHNDLADKIREELKLVADAEKSNDPSLPAQDRREYGPFLRLADPQKLAASTALSVVLEMSKFGASEPVKTLSLLTEVGRAVELEAEAQRVESQRAIETAQRKRGEATKIVEDGGKKRDRLHFPLPRTQRYFSDWGLGVRVKVGAVLCRLLFEVAHMDTQRADVETGKSTTRSLPVFRQDFELRMGRYTGYVAMLPDFVQLLLKEPQPELIAKQLPMIVAPKPWTNFREGGYLQSRIDVLRIKNHDSIQRQYAMTAAERGDLKTLFAGLDVLGSTAWKVNHDVFKVMLEAWNTGEAVANLSPMITDAPNIPKPAEDATSKQKWDYYDALRKAENEKGGFHSQRCFQNLQMEIARAFYNENFYFPHNVDFRGRAYPVPPYLNQMGADNCRGLLLFAQGRELGSNGLRWLLIHLSNVFGYDKASLDGRAQFTRDHLDDIRDSVQNPLNGRRWWLKAEDPWQCLAACHEVVRALDSPDPSKFVSHLPIHQDGSCNGLQHYAALGGDVAGAKQVNLEPGDKPSDVYSGVAELVKAAVKQDLADGVEIAKLLDGRITRKIVKQTVMTNVYGVTFTGASRQVRRQIDAAMPDLVKSGQAMNAAVYITRKIFQGLGSLFEGAHEIQHWLGDCAQRVTHSISPAQLEKMAHEGYLSTIVKSSRAKKRDVVSNLGFRSTMIWTTPLRLPVVQPYKDSSVVATRTSLTPISIAHTLPEDAVNHRKQLQAFPPNFIHSLDASHMILSALAAKENGLSFSAVHDSFWTHAADVNKLNVLLRDTFIRMHSEDIVGRLAAEFRVRYQGHLYLAKIGADNPLAKAIRQYRSELPKPNLGNVKSKKLASSDQPKIQQHVELVREYKRAKLLASEDAAEREEGRRMVTASSLFEQYQGDQFLTGKSSLGQIAKSGSLSEKDMQAASEAVDADNLDEGLDHHDALDPLIQSDAEFEHAERPKTKKTKKSASPAKSEWLWLPLTFRPVPKKGDFDVNRLKESVYFFS